MKIEEYAKQHEHVWCNKADALAEGIRIGLKAAYLHIYECPLDEFESIETQQLIVRVCSMLGGELEEMEDNKRDLPGVGE